MIVQEAFFGFTHEGICLFLPFSLTTSGFWAGIWDISTDRRVSVLAVSLRHDDSIISSLPTFAKKNKKTKKLSKGILTCGSSMTILCHFPSSRILIRIMWCYKVAAESAFSGESRCLGSSAHSEENTYVTDVWSKSKWPVKSHVICRIIREWSEKSWQCPGLKRNTHMHTQTTKMYLKDSIRCTRTENAFGDA